MTGQTKWAVISSLRDKRYTRQILSVEKWIADGKPLRKMRNHSLPFSTLKIGESFLIQSKDDVQYVRNRASQMGKKLERKFLVNAVELKVIRSE